MPRQRGPSPSNVKPALRRGCDDSDTREREGVWESEGDEGSNWCAWSRGTRPMETGDSRANIRMIFNMNESHSESIWGFCDDSTYCHFQRSVSLTGSQASLHALFTAADVTIILMGNSTDVDNEPRQTTAGDKRLKRCYSSNTAWVFPFFIIDCWIQ